MFQASLQLRRHQKSRGWGTGQTPKSSPKKKSPREKNRLAGRPKTRDSECPQGSPRRRPQPSSQSRLFGPCLYLNSVLCCLGCQCHKARWLGNTHEIHQARHRKLRNRRGAMHTPWAVPLVSDTDEDRIEICGRRVSLLLSR